MKSFTLLVAFIFAAIVAAASPAPAQSLRTDLVVVESDLVKLSDIFEGVANDRAVLRAPAPGRRLSVEIQQLMEIARANGLAWRPQTRFDRVLVERMGKTLDLGDILPPLRRALVNEGVRATDDIDLGSRSFTISLPLDAPADVDVKQVQYDRASGRFSATISPPAAIIPAPSASASRAASSRQPGSRSCAARSRPARRSAPRTSNSPRSARMPAAAT